MDSPAAPRPGPVPDRLPRHAERWQHWKAWFASRRTPSARALARRLETSAMSVSRYARDTEPPGLVLVNLETVSAADGYEPLVIEPIL